MTNNTDTERYIGTRFFQRIGQTNLWQEPCGRCGGSGFIPTFSHVHNGVCYGCEGRGILGRFTVEELDKKQIAHDKREAAAERKRLEKCAARDARVAKMQAEEPEVFAVLKEVYDNESEAYSTGDYSKVSKNSFLRDMADNLFNATGKDFTENMINALRRTVEQQAKWAAERAAADANRADVPEGRIQVVGVVKSVKYAENDFGGAWKALIEHESGFKVYGTVPSSIMEQYTSEELKGVTLSFTATVEPSRDDKSFGFFKRPTKASVV